ncbi:mitochondrial carrier domain-containing protein [Gamsiella multidivaricata]|uniref:mitochondrial carrier domain-containing protein n=1 Tax=Gamsiella multidivaricata TaxID=101098 RepID=UPI00221E9833|nr:mitochondrial carrier domain-containing protein [Gamsiella multidivaricata]KAG0350792.1 Mitochondrial carrier protein ymc2 [Gamsiella multidivaricata]KAI7829675.1 mitochondrial carrier domain-containing protein [Gamsiella multidivaricata]
MSSNSMQAAKDCASGTIGGFLQVFVGQPFDTVKVRLQTMPAPLPGQAPLYTGMLDCVKQTIAKEGFRGFYKGTTTPLVGVGACVSIQFVTLQAMKRYYNDKNGPGANGFLSNSQLYLAGAVSGITNSIVSGPVEHIRTRLQVQTGSSAAPAVKTIVGAAEKAAIDSGLKESVVVAAKAASESAVAAAATAGSKDMLFFTGPVDAVQKIYAQYGLKGLFKGQAVTMVREFQGYGAYFAAYEYLVQRAMQLENKKRNELGTGKFVAYGACAGYAMWTAVYPIDVIKSKLQTDGFTVATRQYSSAMDCVRQTLAKEGAAGFFKGIAPCMLRAAPANAVTFLGFEMAMRLLR